MSQEINLSSTNLCIPEDAFDQFQESSVYEEEEFITLSDIVPQESVSSQLPNEIGEIPFDNEVVLSSNLDDQPYDSTPATTETDQIDSTISSKSGNNENVQESTEQISDQNVQDLSIRPKRARKQKMYSEDLILESAKNGQSRRRSKVKENQVRGSLITKTKSKRGRKPKQNLIAQNEFTEPVITSTENNLVEQTPKVSKRGRKRTSDKLKSSLESETRCTVKRGLGRQRKLQKISYEENDLHTSDHSITEENNIAGDLTSAADSTTLDNSISEISSRRRGRKKKTATEEIEEQPAQSNATTDTSAIIETHKNEPKKKKGRPKKVQQEDTANANSKTNVESDDELDNLSLKALSKRNTEEVFTSVNGDTTDIKENLSKNKDSSEVDDIDVGYDELGKVQEFLSDSAGNFDSEVEVNTEVQDMELDETVETSLNSNFDTVAESIKDEVNVDTEDEVNIEIKYEENNDIKDEKNIDIKGEENIDIKDEKNIDINDVENIKDSSQVFETSNEDANNSLLIEDSSKRPRRRKSKKILHYEEESDEDPFANVELSDDEPSGRRKGRYDSDDDYRPDLEEKKGARTRKTRVTSESEDTDISDIDLNQELEGCGKRKRTAKKIDTPKKRGKQQDIDVTTIAPVIVDETDDIEVCLQSSVIQANEGAAKTLSSTWGSSNEFENFIAQKIQGTNIQIKKVSSDQTLQSTPIEIPVLDLEAKKSVERSVQTNITKTQSTGVQTTTKHELPMKDNVTLTSEQSEQACEFLKSIVKTTSELGQLMTQKSEDFISKKIHTGHVTDTFKMDYCVKKSFLLLKLAKHNIVQMEDDLSKQYKEFLQRTDLLNHREEEKTITPKEKDNDSDCEIVEETVQPSKPAKPKFNPKTVFLNKELSIKIAKKPTPNPIEQKCKEKLKNKNKNTVWISDSVMLKKVKPTQSFLAQDGRNKKPPDSYVTEKMVSDFFKDYYLRLAPSICAPFTSKEWLGNVGMNQNYVCSYFFVKCDKDGASASFPEEEGIYLNNTADNTSATNVNVSKSLNHESHISNPKSLSFLCTEVLKNHMNIPGFGDGKYVFRDNIKCLTNLSHMSDYEQDNPDQHMKVLPLKTLCYRKFMESKWDSEYLINKNLSSIDSISSGYTEDYETEIMEVLPLKTLCFRKVAAFNCFSNNGSFATFSSSNEYNQDFNDTQTKVLPLKTLCYKKITTFLSSNENIIFDDTLSEKSLLLTESDISNDDFDDAFKEFESLFKIKRDVKSLFSLCVECLQKEQKSYKNDLDYNENAITCPAEISRFSIGKIEEIEKKSGPTTLKKITYGFLKNIMFMKNHQNENKNLVMVHKVEPLANICFKMISALTAQDYYIAQTEKTTAGMTINSVNTVTEEVFHNMEEDNLEDENTTFYEDDEFNENFNSYEEENQTEENQTGENSWVSQLLLQDLKSCFITNNKTSNQNQSTEGHASSLQDNTIEEAILARVKLEPLEELSETAVDSVIVKTEPMFDQMTIIPESVITKQEKENTNDDIVPLQRQDSSSFDVDSFEDFVSHNKITQGLYETNDDIFTQSGSRVRRQHKPDYMNEYDPSLNLLIPQTFEPLSVVNAKGVLMESSSDEESKNQKATGQKKSEKRRGRPKKGTAKQPVKQVPAVKEKPQPPTPPLGNELAMLTRRMREKIRKEQKKVESSDSESEKFPGTRKKDKDQQESEKTKLKSGMGKSVEDEIQCNNVDSTEQIDNFNISPNGDKNFTGFSAVDQNEITSYQKYVKYVYNKILPTVTQEVVENVHASCLNNAEDDGRSESPLIDYEEPVEMLECEPTMPIFDNEELKPKQYKKSSKDKSKAVKVDEQITLKNKVVTDKEAEIVKEDKLNYIERDGWQCYPIHPNETKLYQNTALILEKLPESFVETYFRYQEISHTHKEDEEVDRLINLNTLNRTVKEGKKGTSKNKITNADGLLSKVTGASRAATPNSEEYAELTASEDEGVNADDEIPPPVASRHGTENHLAKNSLMNDSDSDELLSKIKQEPNDDSEKPKPMSKRKSKQKAEESKTEHPESLMLTADKMMNKELHLLHAPVVLSNEMKGKGDKEQSPKNKHKRGSRGHSSRDCIKHEDEESSEEEKQWVTTKEKLLKRMKKQDTTIADDAKRAKLVCDFIERRGEPTECRKRKGGRPRRQSSRKMLEREKQMRVLQHEMFGTPVDPAIMGTRHTQSQSVFKGRRNIRKVIDKKSLARSTVIANMEEFERKCRLNERQARLRALLGVEDGVNVLVINDEVCLEYSFEEQRPLVSVHPFFTRVMKAHQYEGVKFMWDACFETLEKVESGHPGGGCILAHCMGLGKTLQVLALLHTVLTHPRVGMQRILVCCPLSTVLNWVDEIHKWIGPVTDQIKVFELSKLRKTYERAYQLEDWYNGGGIFIIGYELFRSLTTLDPELDDIRPTIVNKIRNALLDPGPDIIVCDEGHLLKNDCSVLAMAMSRVATKRRIVLTGTPMQNNLREYYCMVNFIKPNLLGTYSEYSNRFENPIMNGQHRDSQEEDIKLMKQRTHILHKVLEGCLQRQEASVLYPYLPKKHEYTVFISLTKVQWDLYKHYLDNFAQKENKMSILRDFHILQKVWSHPQVLHNFFVKRRNEAEKLIKPEKLEDDLAHEDLTSEDVKPAELPGASNWWLPYLDGGSMLDSLETSNKFAVVFGILDECIALGDKVLIFSTSLFTMDALEHFLKKINKWSLGQEYYRLDGSVPAEVRQKWCREFNAEHNFKTKLFLISTRAGCLGLNMVAANRVIILDTSWNPAHDIQSIFRVYRFGQKKDCYIYRLVAMGTMEQKIYERSVTKQAVACRVVDEQQIDRHYNMAELTELYRYDESGVTVAGGVAVGVEDVALLRVARLPALHAVHEHDSLLRGSSEQQLPEHERAAAWMQFQQEHAHKQIQNQLTSSFTLHSPSVSNMAMPNLLGQNSLVQPYLGPSSSAVPEIKTENPDDAPYQPKPEPKGKRGRKPKPKKDNPENQIPLRDPPEIGDEAKDIEQKMVTKIKELLIKHNKHNQSPLEINMLISKVSKVVASGSIPKGGFDDELAKGIADVILMNDNSSSSVAEPVRPNILTRSRGRPKKNGNVSVAIPSTSQTATSQPDKEPEAVSAFPGRRKAAINAEKQIGSISDSIIQLDNDDDWQANDFDDEEIVPETRPVKKTLTVKKEGERTPAPRITQQQVPMNVDESILLSDDDEPTTKQVNTETNVPTSIKTEHTASKPKKSAISQEIIPLHPSLLSNKNFIKIVAHTYLEGNPMLDEDAATLAAQYSTLKAKKEVESTGKPIINGPIFDIAFKVLGIDILRKLHKANPPVNPVETNSSEPATAAPATAAPATAAPATAAPATVAPATAAPATVAPAVKKEPDVETRKSGMAETRKSGPRLKARGLSELTGNSSTKPSAPRSSIITPVLAAVPPPAPSVVPVGLINRAGTIAPNESFAPQVAEESILPDDDDNIISDRPAQSNKPIFKKTARPLLVNSVIAASGGKMVLAPVSAPVPHEPIPKLVISGGKLMTINKFNTITPPKLACPQSTSTAQSSAPIAAKTKQSDTICLDSDEEEAVTPNVPPPTKKSGRKVAMKSTAKLPKEPVRQDSNQPVPVSISSTNPQLNAMLSAPHTLSSPQEFVPSAPKHAYPAPIPGQSNYFMIPSSKLTKLLPGVRPAMNNLLHPPVVHNMSQTSILPTTPTSSYSMPHNMNNQNQSLLRPAYQCIMPSLQPIYQTESPQNVHDAPSMPQTKHNQPTPQLTAPPTNVNPAGSKRTVCKPGDILRITSSGQVEILNRDDDEVSIVDNATIPNNAPSQVVQAPKQRSAPQHLVPTPSPPTPQKEETKKPARRPRILSSSGSDSSRPSSPEDPLSILKDVVQIKAPEDSFESHSRMGTNVTSTFVGNTSITKSTGPSKKSNTSLSTPHKSNKRGSSKTATPTMSGSSTQDDIMKHISQTDTVLKKLDKVLRSNPTSTKGKTTDVIGDVDTIDLDSYEQPKMQPPSGKKSLINMTFKPLESQSAKTPLLQKSLKNTPQKSTTQKSTTQKSTPQKPSTQAKEVPKKVVGTSKDIIISITGKSPSLSSTSSGNKSIRITNVEKVAPPSTSKSWNDKKRQAPTPDSALPKKKKTEPMTLKDFNIDDIDDIIELD